MINTKTMRNLIILLGVLSWFSINAQDVRHTQVYSVPLKLNPALMGQYNNMNFKLNYRSQWASIDDGYNTACFTFNTPVYVQDNDNKIDVGVFAMNDRAGAFNHIEAALAVGYTMKLTDNGHWLSSSIYGGFNQKYLDVSGLTFDEQYTTGSYSESNAHTENLSEETINFIDAGFGVMWYYRPEADSIINAFAGVSGYHVNTPNESFIQDEGLYLSRFTTVAGIKIKPEGKLDFTPNIIGTFQKGSYELSAGLYTGYQLNSNFNIKLGLWYRQSNSFAIALGLRYTDYYLGYSYDLPSSDMNTVMSGINTHEISLSYTLNKSDKPASFL